VRASELGNGLVLGTSIRRTRAAAISQSGRSTHVFPSFAPGLRTSISPVTFLLDATLPPPATKIHLRVVGVRVDSSCSPLLLFFFLSRFPPLFFFLLGPSCQSLPDEIRPFSRRARVDFLHW